MQNYLFALMNQNPCISLARGQLQQLLIGADNPFFREETFPLIRDNTVTDAADTLLRFIGSS